MRHGTSKPFDRLAGLWLTRFSEAKGAYHTTRCRPISILQPFLIATLMPRAGLTMSQEVWLQAIPWRGAVYISSNWIIDVMLQGNLHDLFGDHATAAEARCVLY